MFKRAAILATLVLLTVQLFAQQQLAYCNPINLDHGYTPMWSKGMDKEKPYYFRIEALNENGQSKLSGLIKAE